MFLCIIFPGSKDKGSKEINLVPDSQVSGICSHKSCIILVNWYIILLKNWHLKHIIKDIIDKH